MRILRADTDGAAFSDELADRDSGRFEGALDRLKSSDAGVPVVDLVNVGGISSRRIGVLVAAWAGFMRRSRWFELRASDEVWRQLKEVGAARVFFERPDGMPQAAPPAHIRSEPRDTDTDVIAASPTTDSRRTERSSASLMAETERYVERLAELELRTREVEANAEAIRAERNDYAIRLRTKEAELEDLRAGLEDRVAEARVEESATRRAYERLSARESELVSSLTELREQVAVVERERDAIAAELKGTRARLAGGKTSAPCCV